MTKNNLIEQIQIIKVESLGKGKLRITFENQVSCIVYRIEIRGYHLQEGSYISEEQYQILMKDIVGKRAKKRALHLLEQMDRTEQQLRDKLQSSEYPQECVEDAIDYVKSFHYLDDVRYAENYTRYSQEKLSRTQIKQKLMTKGVSQETIQLALEHEYSADESEHIRRLLDKRGYEYAGHDEGEFRRTYQYLLRRGFRSSDILREMKCKELSYE